MVKAGKKSRIPPGLNCIWRQRAKRAVRASHALKFHAKTALTM
jgi:hypothetical protein